MTVHVPVMVEQVMKLLSPQRGEIWVDATVGMGGHSLELLNRIGEEGFLLGMDRDEEVLRVARSRLGDRENVRLIHANHRDIARVVAEVGLKRVDGVIFDLGVSSFQIERAGRGFSFYQEGPLDMRMNKNEELTASDVVNTMPEESLADIFRKYGEERYAALIARHIARYRKKRSIRTTAELVGIVRAALPMYLQRKMGKHPARRVFQALRMYVNDEVGCLQEGLKGAVEVLSTGGRMGVITFHSIEDRLVKHMFRKFVDEGVLELLNRRVIKPSDEELQENRRARSAKLRGVRKVGGGSEHQR